jgi:hypothetical protein
MPEILGIKKMKFSIFKEKMKFSNLLIKFEL